MRLAPFAAAVLLAGCSAFVPSTADQLANTSPLEADPAALEVALILPPGLAVPKDGARMTIDVTRSDGAIKLNDTYVLQAHADARGAIPVAEGDSLMVYGLRSADAARLQAVQAEAAGWKAETPPPKGRASIGLALDACTVGAGPARDARGSAYIRMQTGGEFLPLIKDANLRELLGPKLFDAIAPCDGAT